MSVKTKTKIGELLKHARERRKLSADDVARQCNVSRSRVYQWETQDYVFPKNLPALSEVLHISIKLLKAANGHSH